MKQWKLRFNVTAKGKHAAQLAIFGLVAFSYTQIAANAASITDLMGKDEMAAINNDMNENAKKNKNEEEQLRASGKLKSVDAEGRPLISHKVIHPRVVEQPRATSATTTLGEGCPQGVLYEICRADMRKRQAEIDRLEAGIELSKRQKEKDLREIRERSN